ncbi:MULTISPECIES: hypothetical protein [Nocardia]|uniref:hypothetical protein n=1 Tax=Nocardia TaxID=1817 RepID=UPI0018E4E9B5|nr:MULTISPECIES: hypothetical protein [Nocardia]
MKSEDRLASRWARAILSGLQGKDHVYQGTVPDEVVQGRRAKNRAARKARRGQRR